MGLQTQACTPSAYEHGNALAENGIQRIRGLAGSLMHNLQSKLAVTVSSSHALWSWCMRHSAWILNRFNPRQSLTPFEVVYGKQYRGQICQYGEPVLGFARSSMKGNPKWRRMLFLGKVEGQDSFLLYDGVSLKISRSVRRVKTNWVVYMGFYKQRNLYSWQYKVGFGARVQPTKRRGGPRPASVLPPVTAVEPSRLADEYAEAVKAKALEELKEESELQRMSAFDKPQEIQREVEFGDGSIFEEEVEGPLPVAYALQAVPCQAMSSVQVQQHWQFSQQLVLRTHDDDDVEKSEAKRSKVEDFKKQRINRLVTELEKFIRTVRFGEEQYHTLDSYNAEPQVDDADGSDDPWLGEEELHFAGVDERLWSGHPLSEQPPPPGDEVDRLANEIEISRLPTTRGQ
eukprot:s4480_g1.t1